MIPKDPVILLSLINTKLYVDIFFDFELELEKKINN